jgi:hypothetical protein
MARIRIRPSSLKTKKSLPELVKVDRPRAIRVEHSTELDQSKSSGWMKRDAAYLIIIRTV